MSPKSSTSCTAQPAAPLPEQTSTSGAAQPAAPLPEDPEEKRVAKNKVAYTKAALLAFYCSLEYAEQEWAAAPPVGRAGPMNALTGRVMPRGERIVQEMYDWYEARADEEELPAVFRHLQNTLFKNVTAQLPEDVDVWKHGEAHFVVSREHVARQVQAVIAWREEWLLDRGLPVETLIRNKMADSFLKDSKSKFHASAKQN